jgi:hydroxypyruvate reductase
MTRRELESALRRALARMDPSARVAAALPPRQHASVIAIGKVAPAMAAGALARWGDAIVDVLVVTTDGTDTSLVEHDDRVQVLRAAHPIPDARSLRAASRCLDRARAVRDANALLLVLVSGGASALVCSPSEGVRLRDKQLVTRKMLTSGASIREINVVRKHLSRIKGGGLARAAAPSRVMTLAVSDVIDGAIDDIGSGPSVGDTSSAARARGLLRRFAPKLADLPLARTGAVTNVLFERIISSPEELARIVAMELRARDVQVCSLQPSQAPVEELAREYVAYARRLRSGSAVVRVAEPSIEVPWRAGKGGRSTHLAALVGLGLPRGALFLAAATDGVDGSSRTAGAIVDGKFAHRVGERAIRDAIGRYDTGSLHLAARTALPCRPSGHNLADVHVLAMR